MPNCSVLVVEDDSLVATEIEHSLVDAGYEVCGTAATEQDAIQLALEKKPKLAVVDVRLSPGSGVNVAKMLDKLGIGVLFTTAYFDDLEGVHDVHTICIKKPYRFEALAEALSLFEKERLPDSLPWGLTRVGRLSQAGPGSGDVSGA